MREKEYKEEDFEKPKVRRIDVEESRKQGTMVYVEKDVEDVVYYDLNDDKIDVKERFEGSLLMYCMCQFAFFPFTGCVVSTLMLKGKNAESLGLMIFLSIVYFLALIISSKFFFDEYHYGTFFKNAARICGGQCLVIMMYLFLFIIYPIATNTFYDERKTWGIIGLFALVYFFDIGLQILILYLRSKKIKGYERLFDLITFVTQGVAIWIYAIIVIPFVFKTKENRLIAYGVVLLFSILFGIVNLIIEKKLRKKNKNKTEYIIINTKENPPMKKSEKIALLTMAGILGPLAIFSIIYAIMSM